MKEGILYIATGEKYINEAKKSARQTNRVLDLPIALITDRHIDNDIFDKVIIDENPTRDYMDKPRNLCKTPFSKTLFVDTDVYILEAIPELFKLLDSFSLAAAVDPNEAALRNAGESYFDDLPESVPEYNTGVLLFDDSDDVMEFFDDWAESYSKNHIQDQPSFRKTLYDNYIHFSSLSPVYNCLIKWPMQITGSVKIIHDIGGTIDSYYDLSKINERINQTTNPRISHSHRDHVLYPLS